MFCRCRDKRKPTSSMEHKWAKPWFGVPEPSKPAESAKPHRQVLLFLRLLHEMHLADKSLTLKETCSCAGIPPRTPGAHALTPSQQPAGQLPMHLPQSQSQPSAMLGSLSNTQASQPPPSQPRFFNQPELWMSSQQWPTEQANLQHTSVTGQEDPFYSMLRASIPATSQLLQTPAQGPGDHPSVSLRLGSQGTTPAPASQGPFPSLTATPEASSPTSSSHFAVY